MCRIWYYLYIRSTDGIGGEEKIHTYVSIPSGRIHKKFQTVVVKSEAGDFTACSFVPLEF